MKRDCMLIFSLVIYSVQNDSRFRKNIRSNVVAYKIKSWKLGLEEKTNKIISCDNIEYGNNEITECKRHQNLLGENTSEYAEKEEPSKLRRKENMDIVYAGDILSKIIINESKQSQKSWKFENMEGIDEISQTGYSIEETMQFQDGEITIRILRVDNTFFSYRKVQDKYSIIHLREIQFEESFLIPIYDILDDGNVLEIDERDVHVDTLMWYADAKLIIQNKYYQHLNKKKRVLIKDGRDFVANIEIYYGEENYINKKISPNVPKNKTLNCTGISHLKLDSTLDRAAFVAFFGSGNHMIRMMLEMSTGLRSAHSIWEEPRNQDGGCFITFSHHSTYWFEMDPSSRFQNILYFNGRGILMIRNPFKAILSWFRHHEVGPHSTSEISSLAYKSRERSEDQSIFYTEKFEKFALENIDKWRTLVEDWVILGDVIVVHFETVISDRIGQLERILKFLNLKKNDERHECLKYCNVDMYKRKSKTLEKSPFSDELQAKINNEINKVNRLLLKYGHAGIPYEKYNADYK